MRVDFFIVFSLYAPVEAHVDSAHVPDRVDSDSDAVENGEEGAQRVCGERAQRTIPASSFIACFEMRFIIIDNTHFSFICVLRFHFILDDVVCT